MRLLVAASFPLGLTGCTLITNPWTYSEVSLATELDRLEPGCGDCLRAKCPDAYAQCADSAECVNYAACRGTELSPPNYWACQGEDHTVQAYTGLTGCQACAAECQLGKNFECVGSYSWPPINGSVQITRRIVDNDTIGGKRPFPGVTVRACRGLGLSCGPAVSAVPDPDVEQDLISWTQTDAAGVFTLELDAGPAGVGFEGLLVLDGPAIPVYRLYFTHPVVSGSSDMELFSLESLSQVLDLFGFGGVGASLALFRARDCMMMSASGVSVDTVTGSGAVTVYASGVMGESLNLEATTSEGGGTGAVLAIHAPADLLTLEFQASTKLVNKIAVGIVPNEISVVQALPGGSSAVPPW